MRKTKRPKPTRWADMCRAWAAIGIMKDFSRAECWRMRHELEKAIKAGRVEQIGRGRYQLTAEP